MSIRVLLGAAILHALCSCTTPVPNPNPTPNPTDWRDDYIVQWYAPFHSGGGYCTEATAFLLSLLGQNITVQPIHHGDTPSTAYLQGLPPHLRALLTQPLPRSALVHPATGRKRRVIAVCHSEPGAWHAPQPHYHTTRCPPPGAAVTIGRTMFETDSVPQGWPARLAHMDYIWVPTEFARDIFSTAMRTHIASLSSFRHGIAAGGGTSAGASLKWAQPGGMHARLVVVAEPVDTDFFAPVHMPSPNALLSTLHTPLAPALPHLRAGATVFLFVGKVCELRHHMLNSIMPM